MVGELKVLKYNVPKEKVAYEMSNRTPYNVTPNLVKVLCNEEKNAVYAAQLKNVTIICHATIDGNMFVFYVPLSFKY